MGGNALSVASVRLSAARYHLLERKILALLAQHFPQRRIEAVLAFAGKPDFGDMDLLIQGGIVGGAGYDANAIAQVLQATEIVKNGTVTSIGVAVDDLDGDGAGDGAAGAAGVFQIDLIETAPAAFDFAARYFSFNDMGNLLGRIAHKFGAKFGHLGLLYPLRDGSDSHHLLEELVITTDFSVALGLLGYDAARYEALRNAGGFQSLLDIFQFVASSPFVNRDIYLLENRNHKSRIRDMKRPTYNAFLDWLATQAPGSLPAYPWAQAGTLAREQQQKAFLDQAFDACPDFKQAYARVLGAHARKTALKRRFNGELAGAVTGLTGKALGEMMARVRNSFGDETAFEDFFIQASDEEVKACFLAQVG